MNPTNIPYCDFTWNPTCGCDSWFACRHRCWARDLHTMRHKAYLEGKRLPAQYAKAFGEIQLFPDRLDEPIRRKKPATIAVTYMGDMFCAPFEFVDKVMAVMALSPQHRFLVLSKQVDRMAEYALTRWRLPQWYGEVQNRLDGVRGSAFDRLHAAAEMCNPVKPLANVWFGTSAGTQAEVDERVDKLLPIPVAHHWLSLSPLVEPVVVTRLHELDWVVIEAESGRDRRPCKLEWVEGIIEQCDYAGTPVFVKQAEIDGKLSRDPNQWPEGARRREIPEGR